MTKAYLMGFMTYIAGKEPCSFSNHWWNPFAPDGYMEDDKETFDEFIRGYEEAKYDGDGMKEIMQLARKTS